MTDAPHRPDGTAAPGAPATEAEPIAGEPLVGAIEPGGGEASTAPAPRPSDDEDDEPALPPAPAGADLTALRAAVADPAGTTAAPGSSAGTASVAPSVAPSRRRATTDDDDDPDAGPRRRRRWPLYLAGLGAVTAAVAVLVVLGQVQANRYALRCGATQITAERGRTFPPWGFHRLGGPAWRPIAIPPDAECVARETEDRAALEGWFLEHLTAQATRKLEGAAPGDLDAAEAELEQALLLSRAPERRDLRRELERLRGDVTYWRAAAQVKAAAAQLTAAARAFDDAAAQRPRHASDPARWATFVRDLAAALAAGPDGTGAPPPSPSAPPRPTAPAGVALPVEGPALVPTDAGVAPDDAPRRDLPTGGVLM